MILKSFRIRLLLAIFGCAAVAIVAGGFFTYAMVKRHMNEEFDHFLGDKLRFHKASCVQHNKVLSYRLPKPAWERMHDPDDPEFFHFRFIDGRDSFRSYSIPDDHPGLPILGMTTEGAEAKDIILPNGNPGRALGVRFKTTQNDPGDEPIEVNLVVAHQRGDQDEALARLRRLLLISGTIAALLLLAATMFIVRQLLRPLASLTQQIGEAPIAEDGGEFSLVGAPQELQPVVTRLNALMERVGEALENERQFTNNAAHELRNPLAGLRSQVEVALERARDPDHDEETLIRILEVQRQMEGAVENLLVLARLDSGTAKFDTERVGVNALCRRAWKPYFERASDRKLKVHWMLGEPSAEIDSSARLLEILLANLFDNAASYTPGGGEITIVSKASGQELRLEVANSNPGIAPGDADGLFRRFQRGAETSTGKRQHAGIGLSLCRKIVETLGGSISAEADPDEFRVVVLLRKKS